MARSSGKKRKTGPREKISSNTDANVPIKKASGHPSYRGRKKKKVW